MMENTILNSNQLKSVLIGCVGGFIGGNVFVSMTSESTGDADVALTKVYTDLFKSVLRGLYGMTWPVSYILKLWLQRRNAKKGSESSVIGKVNVI